MAELMNFSIKQITFAEVLPFWRTKLWPTRTDAIRPMSSMLLGGGYDLQIYHQYEPYFVGLFRGENLIGVLSGHGTSALTYRIRGLYVEPDYRKQGGSVMLMNAQREWGRKQGFQKMWSYPRLSALPVYESFGFQEMPSTENESEHSYVQIKL